MLETLGCALQFIPCLGSQAWDGLLSVVSTQMSAVERTSENAPRDGKQYCADSKNSALEPIKSAMHDLRRASDMLLRKTVLSRSFMASTCPAGHETFSAQRISVIRGLPHAPSRDLGRAVPDYSINSKTNTNNQ